MGQRRRATSADVAREAGVSRATVSYVLNDTPGQKIPDQTREKVLDAARRLAYSPSPAARALRRGGSDVVLGVMGMTPIGTVLGYLLNSLTGKLSAEGLTFVLHLHGPGDQHLSEVRQALSPAGVVVIGELPEADVDDLERSATTGVVHLTATAAGASVPAPPGTLPVRAVLDFAGRRAAQLQAEHLVHAGHSVLAFAGYDDPAVQMATLGRLREQGVRDVCARHGLPEPLGGVVGTDLEGSTAVVRGWADAGVTGVCAYNDETALAVVSAAEDAGLKVPGDLAVIGMDDIPSARSARPPLTTVGFDTDALAVHVRALVRAGLGQGPVPDPADQPFARVKVRGST
ncbi:LacI family DNA-binding transcriptional regulator [Kineococcus sp. SYSU DK003]|uniref:LacI family DNA-binding transcriptional regulator n=1 Tax=Kineococcus sp. SYSU DK003 TaxID=3383124 RepID=UPI003D7E162A